MLNKVVEGFSLIPLFVQYIIIPIILMGFVLFLRYRSKIAWLMCTLITISYMLLFHFVAAWERVGIYTRYLLELLMLFVCILSYRKLKGKPYWIKTKIAGFIRYGVGLIILIIITVLNVNNVRACFYQEEVVKLQFPFQHGTYLIAEGGDGSVSSLMNYHYRDEGNINLHYYTAERYANDIVKLDTLGFDERDLSFGNERDLNSYYIFGETVYSPCDGEVYFVQDQYSDIIPGQSPVDTGNGVTIKMGKIYVMLWHLEKDSILVKKGDTVKAGDPLAKIGNSGITGEPHLHIEACTSHWLYGKGIPIIFDSKNPIKNTIYKK